MGRGPGHARFWSPGRDAVFCCVRDGKPFRALSEREGISVFKGLFTLAAARKWPSGIHR